MEYPHRAQGNDIAVRDLQIHSDKQVISGVHGLQDVVKADLSVDEIFSHQQTDIFQIFGICLNNFNNIVLPIREHRSTAS